MGQTTHLTNENSSSMEWCTYIHAVFPTKDWDGERCLRNFQNSELPRLTKHGNMLLYGLGSVFFVFSFYDLWRHQASWRLMPMRRRGLGREKKTTTVSGFLYTSSQPPIYTNHFAFNQFCSVVVDFWESNLGWAPNFVTGIPV